ncbi:porin family protein [Vreelandella zhanjiangensis]|uniref:porin family protein n=1 Tax=Vreelandella zhanjiangensis TaxID=1121960 RepID=UPI00402A8424
MNKQLATLVIASAMAFSTSAAANSQIPGYVGIQLAQVTLEEEGLPDFKPSAVFARLGYYLVDNFAIEGRWGTSFSDDTNNISGIDAKVEIDHLAGLYGAGYLPLGNSNISVYALAGVTYGKATISALGASDSGEETDFSYGGGIHAQLSPELSTNLEYMSYMNKSDFDVTAVGVGLNYHF